MFFTYLFMFGCYMLSSVLMELQSFILSWLLWVAVRILNDFAIIFLLRLCSKIQ